LLESYENVSFHWKKDNFRKKLGDSPANLLINQGGYGHTTRAQPGVSLRKYDLEKEKNQFDWNQWNNVVLTCIANKAH
jgi:hypothetical protein